MRAIPAPPQVPGFERGKRAAEIGLKEQAGFADEFVLVVAGCTDEEIQGIRRRSETTLVAPLSRNRPTLRIGVNNAVNAGGKLI